MFSYVHKTNTVTLNAARFYGFAIEDNNSDAAIEREIIGALQATHPQNQSDLKAAVKLLLPDVGVNRIGNVADRMATAKLLTRDTGKHGAVMYDLP